MGDLLKGGDKLLQKAMAGANALVGAAVVRRVCAWRDTLAHSPRARPAAGRCARALGPYSASSCHVDPCIPRTRPASQVIATSAVPKIKPLSLIPVMLAKVTGKQGVSPQFTFKVWGPALPCLPVPAPALPCPSPALPCPAPPRPPTFLCCSVQGLAQQRVRCQPCDVQADQYPEQIDWEGQRAQIDAAKAAGGQPAVEGGSVSAMGRPGGTAGWRSSDGGRQQQQQEQQRAGSQRSSPTWTSMQPALQFPLPPPSRTPLRLLCPVAVAGVRKVIIVSSMGGTQKDNFLNTLGNGNILVRARRRRGWLQHGCSSSMQRRGGMGLLR